MKQAFFTPVNWSHTTNIYEVNLRQYTPEGTFAAFEAHLPRLREMGVETLWFMPVTPIATEKRLGVLGSYYACSDYTSTNPEYGTIEDFTHLVEAAHELGFKVLIDWVANHTGYGHTWTKTNPEYYKTNREGEFFDLHGWMDVIDLDYTNRNMQRAMIEAMTFWVKTCNVDGFRCDMAHLVPLSFWRHARTWLDTIKPLFWLAECEEANYHEVFDASYRWKLLHAMEAYSKGNINIKGLDDVLYYYQDHFPKTAMHLYFTTNHDENSHSGSEYERMGDAALPFAVLCATLNGIPLIYSGQEMPNKKRLRFFEKDAIEWAEKFELNDFFKTLLHLRKTNPALAVNNKSIYSYRLNTDAPNVFAFIRKTAAHSVLVILNLSSQDSWFEMRDARAHGKYTEVFTGEAYEFVYQKWFEMKPWQYWVMEGVAM
ncbi:alpha-amylase family glycosyl hydrolase [soil metagenome]